MKKNTFYIAAVLALGISFTSCKKDRTCTCSGTVVTETGASTSSSTYNATIDYEKVRKADAERECVSGTTKETDNGTVTTVTQTCNLD